MSTIDGDDRQDPALVTSTQELARLLRTRRRELGLTQETLSGVVGLNRSSLSLIEQGKVGLTVKTAIRLVQALGMDIEVRRRQ